MKTLLFASIFAISCSVSAEAAPQKEPYVNVQLQNKPCKETLDFRILTNQVINEPVRVLLIRSEDCELVSESFLKFGANKRKTYHRIYDTGDLKAGWYELRVITAKKTESRYFRKR